MGEAGSIVIPGEYRKALGLRPGDGLVLSLNGDAIRVLTLDADILAPEHSCASMYRRARLLWMSCLRTDVPRRSVGNWVLDASVVLALPNVEPSAVVVRELIIDEAAISAVNLAEVPPSCPRKAYRKLLRRRRRRTYDCSSNPR